MESIVNRLVDGGNTTNTPKVVVSSLDSLCDWQFSFYSSFVGVSAVTC